MLVPSQKDLDWAMMGIRNCFHLPLPFSLLPTLEGYLGKIAVDKYMVFISHPYTFMGELLTIP